MSESKDDHYLWMWHKWKEKVRLLSSTCSCGGKQNQVMRKNCCWRPYTLPRHWLKDMSSKKKGVICIQCWEGKDVFSLLFSQIWIGFLVTKNRKTRINWKCNLQLELVSRRWLELNCGFTDRTLFIDTDYIKKIVVHAEAKLQILSWLIKYWIKQKWNFLPYLKDSLNALSMLYFKTKYKRFSPYIINFLSLGFRKIELCWTQVIIMRI